LAHIGASALVIKTKNLLPAAISLNCKGIQYYKEYETQSLATYSL